MTSHDSHDERTSMDKLMRLPIEVQLGERTFKISPLGNRASAEVMRNLGRNAKREQVNPNLLGDMEYLTKNPEAQFSLLILMIDFLFDYARDLNELDRRYIDECATHEQLALAFQALYKTITGTPEENPTPAQPMTVGPMNGTENHGDSLP